MSHWKTYSEINKQKRGDIRRSTKSNITQL